MIKIFELISYLNKNTKRKFIFIFLVIFINSLFEFMTIGAMVPFLSFVSIGTYQLRHGSSPRTQAAGSRAESINNMV